ncbi:MAG: helix-turn-helix domain-containing protein [Polyangia bacterium]
MPATDFERKPEHIGYSEAAKMLGLPRGTLYWLVNQRRVPHVRLGRRLVRFSVRELQAWLKAHTVPAMGLTGQEPVTSQPTHTA